MVLSAGKLNLEKKLKRLKNEDIIWIIYFFIVVFALYSNKLDREYLLKKDKTIFLYCKESCHGVLLVHI